MHNLSKLVTSQSNKRRDVSMLSPKLQFAREMMHVGAVASGIGKVMTDQARKLAVGALISATMISPATSNADTLFPGANTISSTMKDAGIGAIAGNVAGYLFHANRTVATIAGAAIGGLVGHGQQVAADKAATAKLDASAQKTKIEPGSEYAPQKNAAQANTFATRLPAAPASIESRLSALRSRVQSAILKVDSDNAKTEQLYTDIALNPEDGKMKRDYAKAIRIEAHDWALAEKAYNEFGHAAYAVDRLDKYDVQNYINAVSEQNSSAMTLFSKMPQAMGPTASTMPDWPAAEPSSAFRMR